MNIVKEIQSINQKELDSGSSGSWHDQYKDSAYVYCGGLPEKLTEGDLITIFSQYGEVVDISLPRDPATQKTKGFCFIMYSDQRSTVLAVDNLTGSKVLNRVLRVDHVLNYKQLEKDKENGKMVERNEQSLSAHPDNFKHLMPADSDTESVISDASSHPSIDLDDPMRDYLIQQSREAKSKSKSSSKRIKLSKEDKKKERNSETKEERKSRRDTKKLRLGLKIDDGGNDKGKGKVLRIEGRLENSTSNRRERASDYYDEDRQDRRSDRRDEDQSRSYRNEDRDEDRYERRRNEDQKVRRRDEDRSDGRRNDSGRGRDDDRRDRDRNSSNRFADLQKWAQAK